MATEGKLDFSGEQWDRPAQFFDGCWVIANKHSPSLIDAMEVNNRVFVFRLESGGKDVLFVFGCGDARTIEAVREIERETGLAVTHVASNGGAHHLFLDLWYEAFPEARILIPAKRIPFTRNGKNLKAKYPDRWELMHGIRPPQIAEAFGDQIDVVIFDQLFGYKDETSGAAFDGQALDHASKRLSVSGFSLMMKFGPLMKDVSQPNDEVFLLHKKSGLAIAGHNYQFSYVPKGYSPPKEFSLKSGGFPMGLMMSFMMPKGAFKSTLEGTPAPIADSKIHAAAWAEVLKWELQAWTSCHDPPSICGPDMSGEEIKNAIRESIHRSGEDDPTGARLKWNIKHKKKLVASPEGAG